MEVRKRAVAGQAVAAKVGASEQTIEKNKMPNSPVAFLRRQPVWIILAVASGTCAAFNGVFAKLTTTALTSTLSAHISSALSLDPANKFVEIAVRSFFFSMNILFNIAMWALFTGALTRASSTTRVSIVNVSANFFITAMLGWMIFSEKLPPMWWLGAALLAAGNVVIGRREEAEKPGGSMGLDETRAEAEGLLGTDTIRRSTEGTEDLLELEDTMADGERRKESQDEQGRIRKGNDIEAPI